MAEKKQSAAAPAMDSAEKPATAAEIEEDWSHTGSVIIALRKNPDEDQVKGMISKHVHALAKKHGVSNYHILLLLDERDQISTWHADRIYQGANEAGAKKNIFLLIYSRGGSVEPAYLISKTCKRLSKDKFIVGVPRKAKSAATLISLGADEIHMGLMSELGPIDPQFGGLPALGMQNALAILADLSCQYPGASEMIGKYLSEKLDLSVLGYFNRVTQSAAQYAERLLDGRTLVDGATPSGLGDHFVNHYKDHSFVIDADEAEKLLGPNVVKQATKEYEFANEVYESLNLIEYITKHVLGKQFEYVGSIDSGLFFRELKK